MAKRNYAEITPEIKKYAAVCAGNVIDTNLYEEYRVNRGLRDLNGNRIIRPAYRAVQDLRTYVPLSRRKASGNK